MQRNHFQNFKIQQILPTAIASIVLLLSACGGGGSTARLNDAPQVFASAATTNSVQRNVSAAALATPKAGSVTQSSNVQGGVTVNSMRINVTKGPARSIGFTIQETVSGSPSNFLSSTTAGVDVNADPPESTGFQSIQADFTSTNRRVWTLIFTNINTIANPQLWLAGGLYIEMPGQGQSGTGEFGAFFNGGQPFTNPIEAITGQATYDGDAVGIGRLSGIGSTGEIIAFASDNVRLRANFGDASALGSIEGTITGITFAPDSDAPETLAGTLTLGTATLTGDNSGFFTGNTSYSEGAWSGAGKWGGQFYNNGAQPGNVGGTFGIEFDNSVDTTRSGELIGVFGAIRQP